MRANHYPKYYSEDGILRLAAQYSGQRIYLSLRQCKRGHELLRYSANGGCVACAKAAVILNNPTSYRQSYYAARKDDPAWRARKRADTTAYYRRNRERILARAREWNAVYGRRAIQRRLGR
jgi:hypothetical protein